MHDGCSCIYMHALVNMFKYIMCSFEFFIISIPKGYQ